MSIAAQELSALRLHTSPTTWFPLRSNLAERVIAIRGVRSIHVGQGDCVALTGEDQAGRLLPILFFDIGGGCGRCASTFPHYPDLEKIMDSIELVAQPTIILSHWDKDHYFCATRLAATETLNWLVPRQKVGPYAVRFSLKLTNALCFPVDSPSQRYRLTDNVDLYLERVDGIRPGSRSQDKNLCGLACTIVLRDERGNDEERIVLPGDAPYQYIESLNGHGPGTRPMGTISCLFAFHHGSRTHLNSETARAALRQNHTAHRLVFTYGLDCDNSNNFNHPAKDAMRFYRSKGWQKRKNTASTKPDTTSTVTEGHNHDTGGDLELFWSHLG